MLLIYELLTTNTVERGTSPLFLLAGFVKFAYCVFDRVTEKEARKLDVVVKESRSRMVSGKIGGGWWAGGRGGGRASFVTFVFVAEYQEIERKLLFLPEEKHVT